MLKSRKIAHLLLLGIAAVTFGCNQQKTETASTASDKLDRTVLPIQEPKRQTYKELDARNAKAPERWEVKAPEGAPNVVVVLVDDIGFGASSAFGGPINMPNLDKVPLGGSNTIVFTQRHYARRRALLC